MSGASERANGRVSGPVLTSLFLFVPDHSAAPSEKRGKMAFKRRFVRQFVHPFASFSPLFFSTPAEKEKNIHTLASLFFLYSISLITYASVSASVCSLLIFLLFIV